MLIEPSQTPYDLHFRLGRTPIRVHIGFWIFSAILGWNLVNDPRGDGLVMLAIWIGCVFLSILLHEFGHLLAGRIFGADGYIVLYSFGGLAVGSNQVNERWQRIIVSLAGPGIQLLAFAALWAGLKYGFQGTIRNWPRLALRAYGMLMNINLIWPLFNLLPVWPLDGGMVSREICEGASRREGTKVSLMISIVTAGFIAV